MKTVVYTCDSCKQSKSETDLSRIRVNTRGITISLNKHHSEIEYDICKDCLKKKGFIVEPSPEMQENEVRNHNSKTLESKLLDLLEDLGVQFVE